jgi:hypothetical protein
MNTRRKLLLGILATVTLAGAGFAQEDHHPALAKDVDAFHSVLAPLWHKPAGPTRLQQACAGAAALEACARQIKSTDAEELIESTTDFTKQCHARSDDIEAAFGHVHDAFHRLMMRAGR